MTPPFEYEHEKMTTRRDFVKAAAVTAAVPYFWTSPYASAQDENSKPKVAAIGVGGSRGRYNRGGSVAMNASRYGQMIAVCDVDKKHTEEFSGKKFGGKLNEYQDYRKLLEKEKDVKVIYTRKDDTFIGLKERGE